MTSLAPINALIRVGKRGALSQLQRDRHILTGDRAGEDHGIVGEGLDLPKAVTKAAVERCPADAADARGDRNAAAVTSPLLFPSRVTGRRLQRPEQAGKAAAGRRRRRRRDDDLRRTVRTLMDRLGDGGRGEPLAA
ncbi:MAG: hypothetical protein FWD12_07805 [Alphaproteobacteria bacterium]|nr:hypothetical protein [Alphaproteobacteria bacterium]